VTPKNRAGKTSAAIWANEKTAQWMGMTLDHIDEAVAVKGLTVERHHRNALCDVRVTNQDGKTVAGMRGMRRSINGQIFTE
jgi:hypothetical protein